MILSLKRLFPKETYTIGKLFIDDVYFSDTLELPWKDNEPMVSCIPPGTYPVKMLYSPSFKRALPHILDVPGRSSILIHPANWPSDLKGCVGVGKNDVRGGLSNSRFFSDVLNGMLKDGGTITIN